MWNMLKVNNKVGKQRQWPRAVVFIVFFAMVSLLLTLNIFLTFFQCFYCWLWTSKCLLDYKSSTSKKHKMRSNLEVESTFKTTTEWEKQFWHINRNLGGLFRGSFWGGGGGGLNYPPLSKTCWNYARNFKFGT